MLTSKAPFPWAKDLIAFVAEGKKQGKSLSSLFGEYARASGKAKGSVRNAYYEILCHGQKDEAFYRQYLQGTGLCAEKIREFEKGEAEQVIKSILLARQTGRSVRAAIRVIAGGDEKKALRYQNKYRNVLTGDRGMMLRLAAEVAAETGRPCLPYGKEGSESAKDRLKSEAEAFARKISAYLTQENRELKDRIGRLESENLRLKMALRGESATPMLFLEDVRKKHLP